MSFTTTYKSSCGCEFDISVSRDWVDGGIEVDDVCIVAVCDKHYPTKRPPDATPQEPPRGMVWKNDEGLPTGV